MLILVSGGPYCKYIMKLKTQLLRNNPDSKIVLCVKHSYPKLVLDNGITTLGMYCILILDLLTGTSTHGISKKRII